MRSPLACCDRFDEMLRTLDVGIGVIPFHDGDRRVFKLVGRPFDREVLEHYAIGAVAAPQLEGPRGERLPFVTAIYEPIRYCPICGTELRNMIERNVALFDREAQLANMREMTSV